MARASRRSSEGGMMIIYATSCLHMYIYIYIYICIIKYTIYLSIYLSLSLSIYIYMYRERERERIIVHCSEAGGTTCPNNYLSNAGFLQQWRTIWLITVILDTTKHAENKRGRVGHATSSVRQVVPPLLTVMLHIALRMLKFRDSSWVASPVKLPP